MRRIAGVGVIAYGQLKDSIRCEFASGGENCRKVENVLMTRLSGAL